MAQASCPALQDNDEGASAVVVAQRSTDGVMVWR